jgi:hypothetical protein
MGELFRHAAALSLQCVHKHRSELLMTDDKTQSRLAHMVYFSLHDASPQARAKLVAACHELLSGHEAVLHFSVGTRAESLERPVNVRDFDVALHVVFASMAAHDRYQIHPRHLQFMTENRANWKMVRIFDSNIDS